MLDLIIVTGASRGIGNSIANDLANHTKNILILSSSNKINSIVFNCNTIQIQADLANYKECENKIKKAIKDLNVKSLGIVLAGAQLGVHGGLLSSDLEVWNNQYNCNVLGNLAVVKACQNIIESGAKTRIAMFAGGGAAYGYPDFFGYSLSKVAVVRAMENLGLELANINKNASAIAVAPGAVATDMLAQVESSGASIKTYTDISEPTNFVRKFILDEFDSLKMNSKFFHVRDDLSKMNEKNMFLLRRLD